MHCNFVAHKRSRGKNLPAREEKLANVRVEIERKKLFLFGGILSVRNKKCERVNWLIYVSLTVKA